MKAKRAIYSILLILFSLLLAADLVVWFLASDPSAEAVGQESFPFASSEGMTLPEGVTLPEGMTRPESGGPPEGMTLPEGATFPGRGTESEGAGRSRRNGSAEESEADAAETLPSYIPSEVQALAPYARKIYPYRLYILIGAAVGMILCILRLVLLGKKIRQQAESQEGEGVSLRRVALWPAVLLLLAALVLVVFLFPVNEEEQTEDGAVTNERVLWGQVEEKDIASFIQSAGALEEQEAVSVKIPASVTVSSVCVKNGDLVTDGQIVAKADQTSVMQAIATIHTVLEEIDDQLQEAHEAKGSTSLTAPVAGTVKAVYAQAGDRAIDVMNDHGALLLLSLDGRMAVQLPASEALTVGSKVIVTLPDGTELAGEVAFLEEGVATVTVVDRGYAVGTEVFVKTEGGEVLGSGPLSVHKALNITGYLGIVTRVYTQEGSTVNGDDVLFDLSDTEDLAEYAALLQRRETYEKELKTLFELYEDGYIHAPCAGRIEGLDETIPYATLANLVTGLTVRFIASDPDSPENKDPKAYKNFLATVEGKDGNTVSLINGELTTNLSAYSPLPAPSGELTGTFTFKGSEIIWIKINDVWASKHISDIWVGDRLLFTFDSEDGNLVWVIVERTESSVEPRPSPTPSASPNPSGSPNPSNGPGNHGGRISFGKSAPQATPKPAYTIAKKELCTVTPQERMLLTVPIDELDVLALSLGQEADLYLDALPTMGLRATVTKIDPEGVNSGGNTKYSVTLALDRAEQLYPGMNGTVCFPRRTGNAVMTVPLAAVSEEGRRVVVYTAYDEETDELLSPVEVQTGVSDGTDVEILAGLALGDAYCYRYADAISYVTE